MRLGFSPSRGEKAVERLQPTCIMNLFGHVGNRLSLTPTVGQPIIENVRCEMVPRHRCGSGPTHGTANFGCGSSRTLSKGGRGDLRGPEISLASSSKRETRENCSPNRRLPNTSGPRLLPAGNQGRAALRLSLNQRSRVKQIW